jgi:hypothetical protein
LDLVSWPDGASVPAASGPAVSTTSPVPATPTMRTATPAGISTLDVAANSWACPSAWTMTLP